MSEKQLTAGDVAEFFIALGNETGESITNLRLQKLVYYAQAWHLANFGKPLFEDEFQAWVHGPVVEELYHNYKQFSFRPIERELDISEVESRFSDDQLGFLKEVADVYMTYTAYELEKMSHNEDPWIIARAGLPADEACNNVVTKESMMEYYGEKIKD
tara:strand:- start:1344 stop:1817 length:474 start_codon:yes stop_codon:yes gene_type:complete